MRAHKKQLIEWILLVVFWLSVIPGWSQEKTPFAEENTYLSSTYKCNFLGADNKQ